MIDEWGKGAKYWDKPWNPVVGCRKVSAGCLNCYAERICKRFGQWAHSNFNPQPGNAAKTPPKKGVIFVGNMTDIFGEWNSNEDICRWIGSLHPVTAMNLILTKRAERVEKLIHNLPKTGNRFFGITAENQEMLEKRAPYLMRCGNLKKWVSLEPLLGEVNIAPYLLTENQKRGFDNQYIAPQNDWQYQDKFDWVVVGAESGRNRRPCKVEWVRKIVEDCREYGVPVFVKQLEIDGKLVNDIEKFPENLQIRQVPWQN